MSESGEYDMLSLIPVAALFNVLVTSLTVVAIYLLLRRLWPSLALLAGLLVATDPTYLVNSRNVHLDGLLASYMTLSALFLMIYLQDHRRRLYLVLSGLFGGLAILDKIAALVLVPFAALALAIHYRLSKGEEGRWKGIYAPLSSFLPWLLVVVFTFIILWPALWVEPRLNLTRLWEVTEWAMETPHEIGNFFLGKPVDDPGWLYYPVQAAFRLTPLTLPFFLLSGVLFCLSAFSRLRLPLPEGGSSRRGLLETMGLALLYTLAYALMISLASKKLERYLLPIFPMMDILAAMGLLAFLGWVGRLWGHRLKERLPIGVASGLILLLSTSWLRLAPYYSAYFNPLVGGAALAPKLLLIGGAEGLDLAARYLDSKDKAEDLAVATWGPQTVRLHFKGQTMPLRWLEWNRVWTLADYVLFHVSQVQRLYPDEETVAFFQAREPEYVARINGIDYAWVYKTPLLLSGQAPALSRSLQANLGDQLLLLGYDLSSTTLSPGDDLYLTFHWQTLKSIEREYNTFIYLQDDTGRLWLEEVQPFDGFYPTRLWPPGEVLLDRHHLTLPSNLSPGHYRLAVGMREPSSGETLAVEGEDSVVVETLEIVDKG
jgi:4-amino-4-deoxy-L-arabinose transferase-like glycosyltransferase